MIAWARGGPRRPQEAPGGPKRPQGPQEAQGGPKRPQTAFAEELRTRAGSSGKHFGLKKHKNALQKVARPRRREAKLANLNVFVSVRKTRFPHGPADPTTNPTPGAAEDVSSEMPTFFKSRRFVRSCPKKVERKCQAKTLLLKIRSTPIALAALAADFFASRFLPYVTAAVPLLCHFRSENLHFVRGCPKKVEKTSSENTTFANSEHPYRTCGSSG